MKILIIDKDNKYTDSFLEYVKSRCRDIYYKKVNLKKLKPFETYINELPEYKSLMKKYISSNEICITGLYNIMICRYGQTIVLKIDENSFLPNTRIKIIELCKLINNGNLLLKPYPIFTEIFDEIKENIEVYYAEYVLKSEY